MDYNCIASTAPLSPAARPTCGSAANARPNDAGDDLDAGVSLYWQRRRGGGLCAAYRH